MSSRIAFVDRVEQIGTAWLTALLDQAGALEEGTAVEAFSIENLSGVGRGFLGDVLRIRLDYADRPTAAPLSLIVKLPTPEEALYELGTSYHVYEREMRFYRDVAGTTPIRVPRCYHAAAGEKPGSALLVLEDAGQWTPGDQTLGITSDQAGKAIDMIAGLHARWWDSPELEALDWVPESVWDHASLFEAAWPSFVEGYRPWLSDQGLRLGERLAASGRAMQAAVDRPPRTLVHCDFRADNLMLDGPGPNDSVMVLDWQMMARTAGALDPARLVCDSLKSTLPESGYLASARRWHRRLSDLGVEGYCMDEAWRDFRVGILSALYAPVCFHRHIGSGGERAVLLLEALVRRIFHAAETCDALAGLEGL